jgi:PhzF family phenazine biosynthesis protein
MTNAAELYRLSAFTTLRDGGNPAGVWIGDRLPDSAEMQRIASDVGYSETAFIAPRHGDRRTVRYFSPVAEVPFCGHATIASGVKLGELSGIGTYLFETSVGAVPVDVSAANGLLEATLTSVTPAYEPAAAQLLQNALSALRWRANELDPTIPPAIAFAGARHLVIAAATRARLDDLDYDFEALKALMLANHLTTVHLVWRESADVFHARDPFPVGGVVEDPATGAAAAAFGGYLRDAGLLDAPAALLIRQGEVLGRPSRLHLRIPASGGISVSGSAVDLT